MIKSPLFESDDIKKLLRLLITNYCDQQLKNKETTTTVEATSSSAAAAAAATATPVVVPEEVANNEVDEQHKQPDNDDMNIDEAIVATVTTSTSDDATSSPHSTTTIDTHTSTASSSIEPQPQQLKSKWDKLEVYGSLHIRSNNIRLLSCLIDEQLNLNDTKLSELDLLVSAVSNSKYDLKTTSTQTSMLDNDIETNGKNGHHHHHHHHNHQQCSSSLSSMSPPLSFNSSNYEQKIQKINEEEEDKLDNDTGSTQAAAQKQQQQQQQQQPADHQYPFNKKLKAYHQFYNKRKMSEPNKIINRNGAGSGVLVRPVNDDEDEDEDDDEEDEDDGEELEYCETLNENKGLMSTGNGAGAIKQHQKKRRHSGAYVRSHESRHQVHQEHKNDDVDSYLNTSSYTSSSRSRSPSSDDGSCMSKHALSITMSLDRLSTTSRSRSRSILSSRSLMSSRSSSTSSMNFSRRKLLKQSKELAMAQTTMSGSQNTLNGGQSGGGGGGGGANGVQQQSSAQFLLERQAIKCEMNGYTMNESEINAINALAAVGGLSGTANGNGPTMSTIDAILNASQHHHSHNGHHHHHSHNGHHHHSTTPSHNPNKLLCKKQQYIMMSSQSRQLNGKYMTNDHHHSDHKHHKQQQQPNDNRLSPVSDAGLQEYNEHKEHQSNTTQGTTTKSLSPLSMSSTSVSPRSQSQLLGSATTPPIKAVNAAAAVLAAAAQQQQQQSLIKQQQQQQQSHIAQLLVDMHSQQHHQQQAAVVAHLANVNNVLHLSRYNNQSEIMAAVHLAQQQQQQREREQQQQQREREQHLHENGTNGRLNGHFYSRYSNNITTNRRINSTNDTDLSSNTNTSGVTNALTPNSTDEYVPKYNPVLQDRNDDTPTPPAVKSKDRDLSNNEKVRLSPGYDVYISVNDLNACNDDRGSATRLLRNLMDVFFDKSTLAKSSINGTGRITNTLDKHVISALFAYVKHRYPEIPHSQLTRAATDKCVQTRRNFRKKIKAAQTYFGIFPQILMSRPQQIQSNENQV